MSEQEIKKPKLSLPLNIVDLPDDCLLMIFRDFKLYDLLIVAKTCERFRDVTQYSFLLKHRNVKITVQEDYEQDAKLQFKLTTCSGEYIKGTNFEKLHAFFFYFGESMKKLFIKKLL